MLALRRTLSLGPLLTEGFLGIAPSRTNFFNHRQISSTTPPNNTTTTTTTTDDPAHQYDKGFGRLPHAPPPEVDVFSLKENRIVDRIQLDPFVFGAPIRPDIMHQAVVWHRACLRQGTHQAKTVGMVSGSTKKLYKQKGTGKARAGNIRAPQRRGGGVAFPPSPRDYSYALPLKVRRYALRSALSAKLEEGRLVVVKESSLESHKTREFEELLLTGGLVWKREELRRKTPSSLLICSPAPIDRNLRLAARNLENVNLTNSFKLSVYQLLKSTTLVVCEETLEELVGRLGKDKGVGYWEAIGEGEGENE